MKRLIAIGTDKNNKEKLQFVIKHDVNVGFYIYVNDMNGNCIYDYLQDSLQMAIEFLEEEFGISKDGWKEVG